MSHQWDELSKSLAEESLPRRESLRRLGFLFAGAVLSPLGLGSAWARGPDPCKAFCNQCPKSQRSQCLAACRACRDAGRTLLGSCGNYFCCAAGQASCGNYCADLASDPYNCGACGYACDQPGPYEYGACIDRECRYACADGAVDCNGGCTFLGWDPFNCGACGDVCPAATPYCTFGVCTECPSGEDKCGGVCTSLAWDPNNCGACGVACPTGWACYDGVCDYYLPGGGGGDDPPVNP